MYVKAKNEDAEKLLRYFERDLKNCLYSYIDLKKFGIENPNLTVYFDEGDGISCSALKYYEGLQLFDADGKMDAEATAELIRELNSHIVSSTVDVIEKLYPLLKDSYEMEQGYVTEMRKLPQWEESSAEIYGNTEKTVEDTGKHREKSDPVKSKGLNYSLQDVRPAETEEYEEIARLICSDEGVGGHYEPEELREQLLARRSEGMGRNYILKHEGEIIHHAATYAELENLAVISGVITRKDFRGKGVGTLAVRRLCSDLLKEGKKPCLFYYTKQAEGFYKKIGFEEGTGWAKLVLRKE